MNAQDIAGNKQVEQYSVMISSSLVIEKPDGLVLNGGVEASAFSLGPID